MRSHFSCQIRVYDGWSLHALNEIAHRFLPAFTPRFMSVAHGEKKHQHTKRQYKNTNGSPPEKCLQIMINDQRRSAALHVISGGWWLATVDDQVKWVRAGPALLARASESGTVFERIRKSLCPSTGHEVPDLPRSYMVLEYLRVCARV